MGRRKKEKEEGQETQRAWGLEVTAEDLQWWDTVLLESNRNQRARNQVVLPVYKYMLTHMPELTENVY